MILQIECVSRGKWLTLFVEGCKYVPLDADFFTWDNMKPLGIGRSYQPQVLQAFSHEQSVPWEPTTFIFRGYNPYIYIYWGFKTFIFLGFGVQG